MGSPARQRLQVLGQVPGRTVALAGVLGQALHADRVQVSRHLRIALSGRQRSFSNDGEQRVEVGFAQQRRPAGEQLVEDGAQAVNVRGGGQPLPGGAGLFRGHVRGRADDGLGLGQAAFLLEALGQAEVGELRIARAVQQHVGRLEVAVQDAALVGVMDGAGQGRHQAGEACLLLIGGPVPLSRHLEFGEPASQAASFHELQGEVGLVVDLANVVDGDDVGMVQLGGGLGLDAEAAQGRARGGLPGQDHLEGHLAVEAHLPGPVDDAHAAAGDLAEQFVVAKALPSRGGGDRPVQHHRCLGARVLEKGSGDGGRATERPGQVNQAGAVGEELVQLRGQVGMTGQQRRPVRNLAGFLGLQVLGQDLVQTTLFLRSESGPGHCFISTGANVDDVSAL